MKTIVSTITAAALLSALSTTAPIQAQAAPLSVAPSSAVTPESNVTDVRYKKRQRVVRHHRRGHNNAVPAAVLGLFGAALAGAIASSRYDDGPYYYSNGYYPAYGGYYAAPRAYYGRPHWNGGGGWRHGGGGWRHGGGWHHR